MAARRMGFRNIFDPLYNIDDFRTGLLDGTLPATRLFTHYVLPLADAQTRGDRFLTAKIVRDASPLLRPDALKDSAEPRTQLRQAKEAVESLMAPWGNDEPTCGTVLENIAASELFVIPDSLKPLLALKQKRVSGSQAPIEQDADQLPKTVAALEKFLEAPFSEVMPYSQYVADAAPFDTHQGVKGLEFERVMVLMNDSEARGFLFGYEKFFGAEERSAADIKNEREGKETTFDRTRRLFYVTCSRARGSLALVMYSTNPEAVRSHVFENGWFDQEEVVLRL
jgi:DNA helicase-2/ATP-dependent DNA helicase PcrA